MKQKETPGKETLDFWFICPKCKNSIPLLSHFYSEEKQKCILDLKYSSWEGLPDYGIPIWYSCEHENEGKDSLKIDEAYIRALEARNELFYEEYMDVFKETVNKAVRCDSLK